MSISTQKEGEDRDTVLGAVFALLLKKRRKNLKAVSTNF